MKKQISKRKTKKVAAKKTKSNQSTSKETTEKKVASQKVGVRTSGQEKVRVGGAKAGGIKRVTPSSCDKKFDIGGSILSERKSAELVLGLLRSKILDGDIVGVYRLYEELLVYAGKIKMLRDLFKR